MPSLHILSLDRVWNWDIVAIERSFRMLYAAFTYVLGLGRYPGGIDGRLFT
jgi:hypothetical protein